MANNSILFSFELTKLTKKEEAWLEKRIEELRKMEHEDSPRGKADFDFTFDKKDHSLNIYSEEGGNAEDAAEIVREFLADNRPSECFWFEWAEVCSQMRPGEFGGGAAFMTADTLEFLSTSHWARGQEEKFKKLKDRLK